MDNNRKLVIRTPNLFDRRYIDAVNEFMKNKQKFEQKRVKLYYKIRPEFKIYLYGFDGTLKHKYNKIDTNKIISDINTMLMGRI